MDVRFKNFRCFEDTGLLKIKKITLLIGENNSGKTSFMAGLNQIFGLLTNNEEISLNSAPFELGSFNDICHSNLQKKPINKYNFECQTESHTYEWSFENDGGVPYINSYKIKKTTSNFPDEITLEKNQISLKMQLNEKDLKRFRDAEINTHALEDGQTRVVIPVKNDDDRGYLPFMVGQEIITHPRVILRFLEMRLGEALEDRPMRSGFETKRRETKNLDRGASNSSPTLYERIRELVPDFTRHFPSYLRHRFSLMNIDETIAMAPLRVEPQRIYSYGKSNTKGFDPYGENLATVLLKTSKSNTWKRISDALSEFGSNAGLFNKIHIEPLKKDSDYPFSIMVETPNGRTSNLMDVGYGVSQILPLIFEIVSNRGSNRYLIQQPEVHLHPKAQAEFASLISRLSNKMQKNQRSFVVETHSDYMLDRLKYEIKQGSISHHDVGILFFEVSKGSHVVHQIDIGKNGSPINAPTSYRRFFLEEMKRNFQ